MPHNTLPPCTVHTREARGLRSEKCMEPSEHTKAVRIAPSTYVDVFLCNKHNAQQNEYNNSRRRTSRVSK